MRRRTKSTNSTVLFPIHRNALVLHQTKCKVHFSIGMSLNLPLHRLLTTNHQHRHRQRFPQETTSHRFLHLNSRTQRSHLPLRLVKNANPITRKSPRAQWPLPLSKTARQSSVILRNIIRLSNAHVRILSKRRIHSVWIVSNIPINVGTSVQILKVLKRQLSFLI